MMLATPSPVTAQRKTGTQQKRTTTQQRKTGTTQKKTDSKQGQAPPSTKNLMRIDLAEGFYFNMVRVQGGTFTMGSPVERDEDGDRSNEYPAHKVTVSSYYIGESEVPRWLWIGIMGNDPSYYQGDNHIDPKLREYASDLDIEEMKLEELVMPVENVSWNECQEFIRKLNRFTGKKFRLPTEAEWEFAARGGNKSKGYKFSGSDKWSEVGFCNHVMRVPRPVRSKKPNELGIYDMTGNVWEMCNDWYAPYTSSPQVNPKGPASGTGVVFRGGAFDNGYFFCTVICRDGVNNPKDRRGKNIGFRLAMDAQ